MNIFLIFLFNKLICLHEYISYLLYYVYIIYRNFLFSLDLMEVWKTNWLVYGLHRRNEGKVDRLENIGFKKFICLHEYISYLLYYVYIIFRNFVFSLDLMEVWKTNWLIYGLHRRNEGKVDRRYILSSALCLHHIQKLSFLT